MPRLVHVFTVFLLEFAKFHDLVVRFLHVFGDVFVISGPLSARHVEMRSFAARAKRHRNVALHRAVQANRPETIVRIDVSVSARSSSRSPIRAVCVECPLCLSIAAALAGHVGQNRRSYVASAFRSETTSLVAENLGNVARQRQSRRFWVTTHSGEMKTRFRAGFRRFYRLESLSNAMVFSNSSGHWMSDARKNSRKISGAPDTR